MRRSILMIGQGAMAGVVLLGLVGSASAGGIQGTYTVNDIGYGASGGDPRIDDTGHVGDNVAWSTSTDTKYTFGDLTPPGRLDSITGTYLRQAGNDTNLLPPLLQQTPHAIRGLNAAGHVVGYSKLLEAGGSYGSYYFAPGMSDPLTLKGFGGETVARFVSAINDQNQIGGSSGGKAALWNGPLSSPVDLNTLVPLNSGWSLTYASGINNRGEIVGYGENPSGLGTKFLLEPVGVPEPSTLATIALGGALVAVFGSKRHIRNGRTA